MFVKKNRRSGDAIVSSFEHPVTWWHTQRKRERENVAVVRSIVRNIDPALLESFQGQTCAKVDATRSSSQLLAALSIKIRHAMLLTSS